MYTRFEAAPAGYGVDYRGLELLAYEPDTTGRGCPPLLFVHGAFAGAWCWQTHYLPYFAGLGHAAYAVSLRGHGASAGRETLNQAGLNDFVDDVASAVDELGEPPVLVGHSMGGLVVDMALRRGVPAEAGVFLAAVPPTGMAPSALQMMVGQPHLLWQMGVLQGFGPDWVDVDQAQHALFADTPGPDAVLEYTSRMQPESQWALFEMGFPRWPRWGHLHIPVAVLGAEEDAIIPPWMVRTTAWWHGVDPIWIPGAGHAMMLEPGWRRSAAILQGALEEMGVSC